MGAKAGAGVSALEAEAMQLRRALAAAKVEIAEIAGERDELMHTVSRLNQQLVASELRRSAAENDASA